MLGLLRTLLEAIPPIPTDWFIVGILVAVLALVLRGLWIAGQELTEYDVEFKYAVGIALFLIIAAATYLAFATPTLATKNTKEGSVRQDTSNLIRE